MEDQICEGMSELAKVMIWTNESTPYGSALTDDLMLGRGRAKVIYMHYNKWIANPACVEGYECDVVVFTGSPPSDLVDWFNMHQGRFGVIVHS